MIIGSHALIKRFLKGVFELRPSLLRYTTTWDVSIVFNYIKSLSENGLLSLKELTLKLVTLLTILSGQRCQTIHFLDIKFMEVAESSVTFCVDKLVRHSKPGAHVSKLEFAAYPLDNKLCVARCMKEYLQHTKQTRGEQTQLFISYSMLNHFVLCQKIW